MLAFTRVRGLGIHRGVVFGIGLVVISLLALTLYSVVTMGNQVESISGRLAYVDAPTPAAAPAPQVDDDVDDRERPGHGALYVPASPNIYRGAGNPALLAITLTVRNASRSHTLTITHVDYYDTTGTRLRRFLEEPRTLGPMATEDFFVPESDEGGGTGANFLVVWDGPTDAPAPLAQAVHLGSVGAAGVSFVTNGQAIHAPGTEADDEATADDE